MHRIWTGLLGVLLSASAAAQFSGDRIRPWSDVQAVQTAPGTQEFSGANSRTWLASDGRMATLVEVPAEQAEAMPPVPAILGTWTTKGSWLEATSTHLAYRSDADRMQAEEFARAKLEEMAAAAESDAERAYYQSFLDGTAEVAEEAETAEPRTQRFLRVPYAGGELLLDEWSVEFTAKHWDGKGPLLVRPQAWRPSPGLQPDVKTGAFKIPNPLSAGLPVELAGLLRRDTIHGSVVAVLDTAESLEWRFNGAKVRVKIDRGANHGLYEKMDLYGLPPDEGFFAQVSELKPEEAIAELHVSRFAPADVPELPVRGLRFATRRDDPTSCHVDTGVPLRGKVLALAGDPARAKTVDYHAYVELDIDLGTQHGLMAGDRFMAEDDALEGEGRVERVQGDRATVLWRTVRYDEDQEVRWPAPGDALVTPAWKREAEDAFGSAAE